MTKCTNCEVELVAGEVDLCYACSKASPQEKARRRPVSLGLVKPVKPAKPPHINVLDVLPKTAERKLLLGLASGKLLTVEKLMLFPEVEINKILSLKAQAGEQLSGFSSGIGFWGSPEWAIGGAVALGLVESVITNGKAKVGLKFLNEAKLVETKMKGLGIFFDIYAISAIWKVDPNAWRVELPLENSESETTAFIHDGDEYIWVEVDGQPMAIRWSSVESYQIV